MWTVIQDLPMRKTWLDNRTNATITVIPERPIMKKGATEPEVERWSYLISVIRPKGKPESITVPNMDTAAIKVKFFMMQHGRSMPPQVIDIPSPISTATDKSSKKAKTKNGKSKKGIIDRAIKMVRG